MNAKVVIIDDAEVGQITAERILRTETVLGFDTETTVINASTSIDNMAPVSLIQIANETTVWLFRVGIIGLPGALKRILTSDDIIKVGVGIENDEIRIERMFGFRLRGVIDVSFIALTMGWADRSFEGVCTLAGINVTKQRHLGNWDLPQLTHEQIKYAADDAFVIRQAYCRLIAVSSSSTPIIERSQELSEYDRRAAMTWILEQIQTSPNPRTLESLINQMTNSYGPWRRRWVSSDRRVYAQDTLRAMIDEQQICYDPVTTTVFIDQSDSRCVLSLNSIDHEGIEETVPSYFVEQLELKGMKQRVSDLSSQAAVNMMVNGYGGWSKYPKNDRLRWAQQVYTMWFPLTE